MKNLHILTIIVVISIFVVIIEGNPAICTKTKTEIKYRNETIEYTEVESVEVKCKRKFFSNPFKQPKMCQELRNVTKTKTELVPYEENRIVKECCPGYERRGYKCIPICEKFCENSKCTGPNVCKCNKGYTHFNDYRCVPACNNCEHGQCIAPNVCDCYNGYEAIDGVCKPICDPPCEYGVCSEPNVCDFDQESKVFEENVKIRTTTEEYEDDNDDDVEYDDEINARNADDHGLHTSEEIRPMTSPKTLSMTTTDIPSLSSPSNPCSEGYGLDSSGDCKLQCEIDCHYGTYQHGTCSCNEGFRNSPANPCVCEPHCDNECHNGLCIGNNTCLCDEGYKLNPEDNFICLDSNTCHCLNGDCANPDVCNCWPGYKLVYSETNYHRCEPLCGDPNNPEGCVNGRCFAPYLCQCNEGFIHGPENNFTCYANMNCDECIKSGLNCLPSCYTTTTTTSRSTTESESSSSESIEITPKTEITYSDDEYDDYSVTTDISEYPDTMNDQIVRADIVHSKYRLIYYGIIVLTFIILMSLTVILIMKRINKPIDYDVNRREHSENNVYFIKKQDNVKLELENL
uniref:CSON001024 protein n=1 Tax=Culicoides sonorensis TaxID=179676 RepID=A0A336KZH5_CULSO